MTKSGVSRDSALVPLRCLNRPKLCGGGSDSLDHRVRPFVRENVLKYLQQRERTAKV